MDFYREQDAKAGGTDNPYSENADYGQQHPALENVATYDMRADDDNRFTGA